MKPFTVLDSVAAWLPESDVNTDILIRIDRVIAHDRAALGPFCFEAWRFLPDGSENPDFILNAPSFRDAAILICGPNFGCGSSREAAVWALQGLGIRCLIAPSFGAIFLENCYQNGVLPVVLPPDAIAALAALAQQGLRLVVDLTQQTITAPRMDAVPFVIDPARRAALLEGLDQIDMTFRREAEIAAYQAQSRTLRPWIFDIDPLNATILPPSHTGQA